MDVSPAATSSSSNPIELTSELFPDVARLDQIAADHAPRYRQNQPFPHTVIDDFLPLPLANAIERAFPRPKEIAWDVYVESGNSLKLTTSNELLLPPLLRHALWMFNSGPMIRFLEKLTGIAGLLPDPYFAGGGLHQLERGGFLNVHADFNYHATLRLDRRINLLLYLNRDWREEYGGQLELWDPSSNTPVKRIVPTFNRCVVFDTTDFSPHGNPTPVNCPPGVSRRSLALYYYSNGRPEEETKGREGNAQYIGGQAKAVPADYASNPMYDGGHNWALRGKTAGRPRRRASETIRLFLPPILIPVVLRIRRSLSRRPSD
jgi:hypothetical protein